MKAEWKDIEFVFVQYKDTGISILSAVDDLQVSVLLNIEVTISCLLTREMGRVFGVIVYDKTVEELL